MPKGQNGTAEGRLTKAVFPGSFDPLTNGHVDIAVRSLNIFGHLTIAVLDNSEKSNLFSVNERVKLIRDEFRVWGDSIVVTSFSGLLVDFVRTEGIKVIVRGLRAISDFEYEMQLALMNRRLSPEIETTFMATREENSFISSSLVKQIAAGGGDVSTLVPQGVSAALKQKFEQSKQRAS